MKLTLRFKGGPGSGHHGHSGRPGQRGGSSSSGGGGVRNSYGLTINIGDRVKLTEDYAAPGNPTKTVLGIRGDEVELQFPDGKFYMPADAVYTL